jgi:hypothetical protein
LRCVSGGLVSLGIVTATGGVAVSTGSLSHQAGLVGGEPRHYQFWYRNGFGPCGGGFNLTSAVNIHW